MPETLDPRNILRGFDGELYNGDGDFLAEVNTFQAQVSPSNQDYQPAGSALVYAVMMGYHVTLTLTETVIKDARMLKNLIDALKNREQASFNFQGVLRGRDGTTGRYVFRDCVPDGNIDIVNVQPGKPIDRAWSFRVNNPPDLQELLGGAI